MNIIGRYLAPQNYATLLLLVFITSITFGDNHTKTIVICLHITRIKL